MSKEITKDRKLILHLDVFGTIVPFESSRTIEENLNIFLSGLYWGERTPDGDWAEISGTLSLKPPHKDSISYYKYYEEIQQREQNSRESFLQKMMEFTNTEIGKKFKPNLDDAMQLLKVDENENDACEEFKNLIRYTDGDQKHYFFLPALSELLRHLSSQDRPWAIILRCYCRSKSVMQDLLQRLEILTKTIPTSAKDTIHVNPAINEISRTNENITLKLKSNDQWVEYHKDGAIYDALSELTGITGISDDYPYWRAKNFHHTAGKPFWIDKDDKNHTHIFFDDNFRSSLKDHIINLRLRENSSESFKSVSNEIIAKYEDIFLVQNNLMSAINNQHYFVDEVKTCEDNLSSQNHSM